MKIRGAVSKNNPKDQYLVSFSYHSAPAGCQQDLKINKDDNKLKTCNPKYKQNEKSYFFECIAILLKTGGLNGCTFTVVL